MTNLPDLDLQIFQIISKIIDLDVEILDLEFRINDLNMQIYDFWNNLKNMEVPIHDFWNNLKKWRSNSWISTQIQDWAQNIVFEMVYLLLRTVFEITRIIGGAADCHSIG